MEIIVLFSLDLRNSLKKHIGYKYIIINPISVQLLFLLYHSKLAKPIMLMTRKTYFRYTHSALYKHIFESYAHTKRVFIYCTMYIE